MIKLLPQNNITLLHNGAEYFPSLMDAIGMAQQEIFLESYLYVYDEIGRQIGRALKAAAERGVIVNLLLDGFGAVDLAAHIIGDFKQAGVRLLFFRPEKGRFSMKRQRLRRMHRKLAVFDGKVAFVGGINILSDNDVPYLAPRYDYAVRVEGPLAAQIHTVADRLWRHTCWMQLKFEWSRRSRIKPDGRARGDITAGLAIRDNVRHRHAIEDAYLQAFAEAKDEIVIANAYFLPARRFCDALLAAAARGVKVHLLVQGQVENFIQYFATRTLYKRFISGGVEVHEYLHGFMHAKVATVDSAWATVGSSNIDPFSLLLAREANVFITDTAFCRHLRDDVMRMVEQASVTIRLADLKAQPWLLRLLPGVCYQIMRAIMGLVGYGKREYD